MSRQGGAATGGRGIAVLALTGLGAFIASLDVSLANGLLGHIGASVHDAHRSSLAWILTAYAIVFAAILVPAGSIADRIGRRRVFTGGLALVAAGSVLCTAAPTLPAVVAGRVVQAVGAAAAAPASLGLLLDNVPPADRTVNATRWAGVGALGIGLGPILGGLVCALTSWRYAFALNLPLAAIAILAARRLLRETSRQSGRRFPDPLGAVLLAAACATLTLAISQATTWGLADPRLAVSLTAAVILAPAFVWRCRTVANPLLDLNLLRRRQIALTTAVTLLYSAAFFGLIYSYVQFLAARWHLDLTDVGLAMLPIPGAVMLLTLRVGRVAARLGLRTPIVVGLAVMGAGLLITTTTVGGDRFDPWWLAILTMVGIGSGLSFPLLSAASVAGLPSTELAAANAVNQCARQIGAALGVAVTVAALGSGAVAQQAAFHLAWLLGAAFCAAGLALAFGLAGRGSDALPDRGRPRSARRPRASRPT